ncbi:MAG: hypothetical protein KatS3mg036_0504 [Ignavibacterium sp.]|uniref:hypothetical protein n=1 Tax=Ignavibacterium sp. TaxID=2651167 RepID=UPI0021DD5C53|nr:hypothetical protein [Ignavibacterium sp.]BDQ01950.1 MAG: hypothetical protein KatS3mg037_0525 [Ignavibacterium sp.]GIV45686.1 MAG: hypothetical protein KatS3mg036_0504 [Ignavibacterium sp.]
MIILSDNFKQRIADKDTRKIILAHLYYNDTEYFAVATTQTVVDGVQYLGIINKFSDITQQWNILSQKNNITVTSPRLVLSDYQTPDGYSIFDDFVYKHIFGRRLVIFMTYEGLSLQDSLRAFDGWVDDVNFGNSSIIITGKTSIIPERQIAGRKINYDTQTIGDDPVPAGFKILKEFDKKVLPVVFGKHWCSPIVPYLQNNSIDWKRYYSSIDNKYSTSVVNQSNIRTNIKHFNINKTASSILIENDDYYTPLYETDFTSDILKVYTIVTPDENFSPGILLPFQGGHTKRDGNIFVTVPLRYEARKDLPSWFTIEGASSYDNKDNFPDVFNNLNTAPFVFTNNRSNFLRLWVKAKLDLNKNLRVDEQGHIRKLRRIHIPSTDSNNGGQGFLLGRWEINIGAMGYFHDNIWTAVDIYPFVIHHWKDGFCGEPFDLQARNLPQYLGAGTLGLLTPDDCKTEPYNYWYNAQARIFTNQTGSLFYDFAEADNNRHIGLQGNEYITPDMGKAPFINRESFTGENLGAAIEFTAPTITLFSASTDDKVKLYKAYHLTAGAIDLSFGDNLYGATEGYTLTISDELISAPAGINNYLMKRPYEFIEFLLRRSGETKLASTFNYQKINSAWESVFSNKRDFSGFVIDKEITLDKFIDEYQQAEPFSVYVSEDDSFNIAILKATYTEQDIVDFLDYADATVFDMSLTDAKEVAAEINHIKTDYMHGLDDFVIDEHFRLDETQYDYSFWKANNTVENNTFVIENIEKKYSSYVTVDVVSYSGKYYGCAKTCKNIPPTNSEYWTELIEPQIGAPVWNNSTLYAGEDAEAYMIAKFLLNQRANRHRVIQFETDNLSYLRFNVGDVVGVANVPKTLLGLHIKGFAGAENFTATVNNQTVYSAFVITSIRKSINRVEITAVQLHDLSAYNIIRV